MVYFSEGPQSGIQSLIRTENTFIIREEQRIVGFYYYFLRIGKTCETPRTHHICNIFSISNIYLAYAAYTAYPAYATYTAYPAYPAYAT